MVGIQTKRACQGIETFHPMSGKWWVFKQRGRVKVLKRFTLCRGSGGIQTKRACQGIETFHPMSGKWWYSNKEGVSRY